ncbi:hypothetical protein HAX54_011743 [Datura stramonium]|uniref:Uncharacterized protein n=1 Tax=Datura stramonium TaxID=4076 RepID=A0ABS8TLC6_DATST|nr:hypothetical protein [Datura stramonium]
MGSPSGDPKGHPPPQQIVGHVGTLLELDTATKTMNRPSMAKVRIEIDLLKPLKQRERSKQIVLNGQRNHNRGKSEPPRVFRPNGPIFRKDKPLPTIERSNNLGEDQTVEKNKRTGQTSNRDNREKESDQREEVNCVSQEPRQNRAEEATNQGSHKEETNNEEEEYQSHGKEEKAKRSIKEKKENRFEQEKNTSEEDEWADESSSKDETIEESEDEDE